MRKSLLGTIAGAALIAGGGLAVAQQRMDDSLGPNGAKGSSQRELGGAPHERQPGAMQGQAEGRSGAIEEKERRPGQSGEMQGQTQKRSSAIEEKERRSGQSGEMQGQTQKRSGAIEEKGRLTSHNGAMQGEAQGRSGRSVGSSTLSPDQKTRLHGIISDGNIRRIDEADFPLSVGTRVPDTVVVYDIPDTIIDIVPEYRGFDYIVVRDELLIIDPETLEIVAVLPG
jgi:hypothetical protein